MKRVLEETVQLKRTGQWHHAIQDLSDKIPSPTELIQLLNERAECYERLNEYQACIKDCDLILKLDSTNIQANKLKVICLFGLKQYPEAKRLIQQLTTTPTGSVSASSSTSSSTSASTTSSKAGPYELLFLLQKRIEEELQGVYDMGAIREECFASMTPTKSLSHSRMASLKSYTIHSGPCVRLSPHGDYIHPMIECITVPEKGVGLRVKSQPDSAVLMIPKGTLLMCCTAIFIDQKSDTQPTDRLDKMKRKLNDQPELLAQVQRLLSHSKFNSDRMQLIQQINPIQLSQQPLTSASTTTSHLDLNDEQLKAAFQRNCFGDSYNHWQGHGIGGTGLWFLPSFFNHSCVSNCEWHLFGSLMFIHAKCAISYGEELTINYHGDASPTRSFLQRQTQLATWEFQCHCPYCHIFYQFPKAIELEQELIQTCDSVDESLTASLSSEELHRLLNQVEDAILDWHEVMYLHVSYPGLPTVQKFTAYLSILRSRSSSSRTFFPAPYRLTLPFRLSPLIISVIRPFQLQLIIINKLLNMVDIGSELRSSLQPHRQMLQEIVSSSQSDWNLE